ncbi:MAG: hypothetical protein WD844_08010 [Thermoleophilaceae bacterium]
MGQPDDDPAREPDELVSRIIDEQGVSRHEAEFIAAIERGEIDGDEIPSDDREREVRQLMADFRLSREQAEFRVALERGELDQERIDYSV